MPSNKSQICMPDPSRSPRWPPRLRFVYRFSPIFFVTFVTANRKRWLANEEAHHSFLTFAERASREHQICVGRYVIMPDHVHLLVRGGPEFRLSRWVGMLRRWIARDISAGSNTSTQREPEPAWQEGFFDHVLRSDESLSEKTEYIRENPVRAGLVQNVNDWPFGGCLNVLTHASP